MMTGKEFNEIYNIFFKFFQKDVLRHEGGYVNHPNDKGGETKYGISSRVWKDKIKNIKELTEYQAFLIYFVEYFLNTFILDVWNETKNFQLVSKLVDMNINIGLQKTQQIYQKAIELLGIEARNTQEFIDVLIKLQKEHYESIVRKNPKQEVFLRGWYKRAEYRGFQQ